MEFTKNLEQAEKLDNLKTKVMKYVLYKKRTEFEVREKFRDCDENLLEEVIEFLKENNYINDDEYIERSIYEFKNLRNLSIKEINYKLLQKGLNKNIIENYINSHKDELDEFEINSAKNIICKKSKNMELMEIKGFLYKKGYKAENIEEAIENLEE